MPKNTGKHFVTLYEPFNPVTGVKTVTDTAGNTHFEAQYTKIPCQTVPGGYILAQISIFEHDAAGISTHPRRKYP